MHWTLLPKSQIARVTLLLICLGGLGACAYRHEKNPPPGSFTNRQGAGGPAFAQVREEVFSKKCTSCHTGYHSSDFVEYDPTYAERDAIRSRVFVDHTMPKGDTLSAEQSSLLQRWLEAGAPNEPNPGNEPQPHPTVTVTSTPTPISPLEPTWQNVQAHFFKPYCTGCHSGPGADAGLDLTSWTQVRSKTNLIVERALVLPEGDPAAMPPSRRLRAKISDEEKILLLSWMQKGAPGPVEPSPAPVEPSPAPVEPSPAPIEPSPAPLEPTWQNVQNHFFAPYCIKCHRDFEQEAGAQRMATEMLGRVLKEPEGSYDMPPSLAVREKITDQERQLLRDWVSSVMTQPAPSPSPVPSSR